MTAREPEHVGPHRTPPSAGSLLVRTPSPRPRAGSTREPDPGPGRRAATIEVRPVDAAHGVMITVTGALESADAAVLGQHLGAELDRGVSVIVVDLSRVPACDPAGIEVLAGARDRARHGEVAMHLVHLGAPGARRWLVESGLG
jgi:anti-anti-sigma regulatory factor